VYNCKREKQQSRAVENKKKKTHTGDQEVVLLLQGGEKKQRTDTRNTDSYSLLTDNILHLISHAIWPAVGRKSLVGCPLCPFVVFLPSAAVTTPPPYHLYVSYYAFLPSYYLFAVTYCYYSYFPTTPHTFLFINSKLGHRAIVYAVFVTLATTGFSKPCVLWNSFPCSRLLFRLFVCLYGLIKSACVRAM
jgi:hypothetical protein